MKSYPGRLALQQRVLPSYRLPFFEALAERCRGGLSLFAGQPRPQEAIDTRVKPQKAQFVPAHNQHLMKGALYLCRQPNMLEWLRHWQPDVLVVEANPRYLSTPEAINWMHAYGRPVLGWGLGAPPISGLSAVLRLRARDRLLHSLDGVISYSQRGALEYRAFGIPPERVFVAHNAISPPPNAPAPKRPYNFKDQPYLLFVGRLQKRKRLDLLFKACAAQKTRPRLVVVGDGPQRAKIEAQASVDYPQTEFVGAKYGEELEDFFRQADLFVLPGTGGLAAQQALFYALPLVVAEGDGTQQDMVRPENGWLLPPNDLQALTSAISEAIEDPVKLRQMGAESYRIAKEEINIERMVDSFVDALNQVRRK